MLAQDYTYAFTDTGQILNTDANHSVPFVDVTKVLGFGNAPLRTTEREREGMDGGFIDALYESMRVITIEGNIYNATEAFLDTLKANYAPSAASQPFYFYLPVVGERIVYAKSYGIHLDYDNQRSLGIIPFQIILKAEDPSIYGQLQSGSAIIGGSSTGFGFNLGFNIGFGGSSGTNGTIAINNTGNRDADATFTITGPVTNPAIANDTTGKRITFNIVLGAIDYLTINLRNKTVTLNGTANRRGTMLGTSTWFLLVPGVNSIRFLGTAGGTPPSMTYITRPAYR